MTKTEVYELCEENLKKWETVARDCLDDMAFDEGHAEAGLLQPLC